MKEGDTMMFGHNPDDEHHDEQHDQAIEPTADGALTALPANEPEAAVPETSAPSTDSQSDGGYIMDDMQQNSSTPTTQVATSDVDNNELLRIKQEAIQSLAPMVGHLDQKPEDEFRTTMMMIQTTDNAQLVPIAYAAAQKITDEKTKAQALLDIINEINYFTQMDSDKGA